MKFIKKTLFWASFGAGIFVIIALIISLILPGLIGPEYIKNKIIEQISRKTGHQIQLQSAEIQFFPLLHVEMHHAKLSIPGKFNITIDNFKAYPEILPLFKRKVNINRLYLDTPTVRIFAGEKSDGIGRPDEKVTLEDIERKLKTYFSDSAFQNMNLSLQIRNGKAGYYKNKQIYFEFDNISSNIKVNPGWVTMTLNSRSNFCEKISLAGKIYPYTSTSEGQFELVNLNLKIPFYYFSPDSDLKIINSKLNFKAHFEKKGSDHFSSNFDGEISAISFKRKEEKLSVSGKTFSGSFIVDRNETRIVINKLLLENPGLIFSGNFRTNNSIPLTEFELKGEEIDINTAKKPALFLTGDSATAKGIFDIINEGKVPAISIKSKAPSIPELGDIKNISIKGNILDGKIHVPHPLLELESVKGDVTVSGGILEGNNLEGRLGNSTATNGSLKLGFSEKNDVFYLDAKIDADLYQLPPVLKQVVEDKVFLHELSLIKECRGHANGILTINNSDVSTHVQVNVSEFNIQGVYERFPAPLVISGEKFFWDDSLVYFKLANAAWGKSSISNLSAGFRHDKENSFKILSGKSIIHAKDINPFVFSFQNTGAALKNVSFPEGTVNLNSLEVEGPLFTPRDWNFNTSGRIENMIMNYPELFIKPVTITTLIFKTPEKKSLKKPGDGRFIIEECRIASGRSNIAFKGNAALSKGKIKFDFNATADYLEWPDIRDFAENKLSETSEVKQISQDSLFSGIIKAKVKYFKIGDLTLSPVHTDITFGAGHISLALVDAELCGVSLTGIIERSGNKADFRILPFARDEKLDSSINCLFNRRHVATGSFSLDGEIFTKGKGEEITSLLNGTLDFKAKNGRIYQLGFLSKIFALLNLTEIFRGKIPDLVGEGFAYNTIAATGKLENGNFVITSFVIDGASMAIVCTGNIDLNKESVDLIVLVSPFKTIDLIIKYIPVITQILDGNIISIPFRVTGRIDNPDVTPLSPTAVGSGILKMLQRTVMLPIKIMQPVDTVEK
jgi:hypothetical protein